MNASMTARGGAAGDIRAPLESAWNWIVRWTPAQGWVTLGLFILTLLVTASLVTDARWVELPGLRGTLILSALCGLGLAKIRRHAALLHPIGLAVGAVVVVWNGSQVIGGSAYERLGSLGERLSTWYQVASGEGISTDVLPMSMGILGIAWLLGYLGSWFIYRRSNVWVGVLIVGVTILTTLSYLPLDIKYTSRFFLFTLLAMLLIVRMSSIQRQADWQKTGTSFQHSDSWTALFAASAISIVVLLAAALIPARVYISDFLVDTWRAGRSPVEFLEEEFSRLFGIVPSRKNAYGRYFGSTMPFKGEISFDGDTAIWADSGYPSYWTTRTYSEYTSKGWKSGRTEPLYTTPDTLMPAPQETAKRLDVNQTVMLNFETKSAMAGGELQWISEPMVLHTLQPKRFELNLLAPVVDPALPEDVRGVAVTLRDELNPLPEQEFVESYISRLLPQDLVLLDLVLLDVEIQTSELSEEPIVVESVILERKAPVTQEVVSWRFAERLDRGDNYSMVSSVSLADGRDLRNAETEYSGFIRDHYVSLPVDLPDRVGDLAADVTANAPTPYDKVLGIQDYLRSPIFTFSQGVEAPPPDQDAVDHFLFETQTGYSDHYASAMAVMLRSIGVPARLAGGYSPGVALLSGTKRVADRDSHVWVQVYFPEYGWIDFEPTPNWDVHTRQLPSAAVTSDEGALPLDRLARPDPTALGLEPDLLFPGGEFRQRSLMDRAFNLNNLVILASVVGGLGVLALFARTVWMFGLGKLNPAEQAYAKMNRLGSLAGIGRRAGQTATDYALVLGGRVPQVASAAAAVSAGYSSITYGRGETTEEEELELNDSWRTVRRGLFRQTLRRIVPIRENRVR